MTNEEEQLLISGFLGDGSVYEKGVAIYTSVHKEYMEFKNATTRRKTNIIKEYLKIDHSKELGLEFKTKSYINSDFL